MKNFFKILIFIFSCTIFFIYLSSDNQAATNNGTSIEAIKNDGFNDPIGDDSSQIRKVGTESELEDAVSDSSIHKIVLTDDITLNNKIWYPRDVSEENFVIDGQGHTVDFRNTSIKVNDTKNIYVENMKMLNGDWYGPIRLNDNSIKGGYD